MASKYNLNGWIADLPQIEDKVYSDVMKFVGKIHFPLREWLPSSWLYPTSVDLRTTGLLPPVMDQGQLGDCVDNAWDCALQYLEKKEGGTQVPLSRLFMYWNARGGGATDSGSTIRSAIKGISKYGVPDETVWPYNTSAFSTCPPSVAWQAAIARKNIVYARLSSLDDMLHCLASGYPIVFGVSLYTGFDSTPAGTPVAIPNGTQEFEGGHSMCIIGYDLSKKCFLVQNSWGTDWCDNGYCWIPFDYLCNPFLADDFWTCRYIPKVA